ncbi:MAG: DUF3106 domain-containing protein [Candidatus Acidiferrales bacterium]|jgi:hypothetical protein
MKLRFHFGAVLAVVLVAGLTCSPAFGEKLRMIAQTAAQQKRAQQQFRREQLQPKVPNPPKPNPMGPGPNANRLPPQAIERLQDLPPDKQEKFLQNNQRFQNLPPQQQAQIRQRLQAWNRLTPGQQQNLRERQQIWEQMTPAQRGYVQQSLLPRWEQLAPLRRQAIMQRLHSLRDLSEPERQAKLNDPAFAEGLNPEDREMLGQLAHLHVGMAPDAPGM